LSRPFSIVPIRLSAPYYDPAVHTHTAEGTNLQKFISIKRGEEKVNKISRLYLN
jgi:hypothetical protein